jgi:hypothetical protein
MSLSVVVPGSLALWGFMSKPLWMRFLSAIRSGAFFWILHVQPAVLSYPIVTVSVVGNLNTDNKRTQHRYAAKGNVGPLYCSVLIKQ